MTTGTAHGPGVAARERGRGGRAAAAVLAALFPLLPAARPAQGAETPPAVPVRAGETLTYRFYWGLLPVGTGSLTVQWAARGGRRLLALTATARTAPVVATLYPVDDMIQTLVDPDTLLPVECSQCLSQGWQRYQDVTVFDHAAGKARWKCLITGATRDVDIAGDTRDPLTVLYHMRRRGLKPGERVSFRVLVDNKLYDLTVDGQEVETVRVPGFGARECLRVEPRARFGQVFVRKGRMQFWFSTDPMRVCTRITGQMPLVSVKAVLTDAQGLQKDGWDRGPRGGARADD